MITVIATVVCKPGYRADFLAEFARIIPAVHAEKGCIEYGPTIDAVTSLDKQNCNKERVTIVEKWESLADLEAHLVASHMIEYRPRVSDFVESTELRILQAA